jgi:hypothetical protein
MTVKRVRVSRGVALTWTCKATVSEATGMTGGEHLGHGDMGSKKGKMQSARYRTQTIQYTKSLQVKNTTWKSLLEA